MIRHPGRTAAAFVDVMKYPVGGLTKLLLDGEIKGREHLPAAGPYIVTANHLSLVDPVFVTLAVGRLVQYMALDELFGRSKAGDEIIYYFGSIPLSRVRPPLGALKRALEILENNEILGVFPEGARARYWGERTIKRGAAWLALATNSPIIPCSITGTEATLSLESPRVRAPSIRVTLHPPIHPVPYIDYEDPLGAMMNDWAQAIGDDLRHWQPKGVQ